MAEASKILHTTLIPNFSTPFHKTPSHYSRRTTTLVRCSISTAGKTAAVNSTIPWGCDIDSLENAEALQKWLSDSGLPPQKMAIERVDVGERGLVALKKELQIHNRRRRILEASAMELLTAAVFSGGDGAADKCGGAA